MSFVAPHVADAIGLSTRSLFSLDQTELLSVIGVAQTKSVGGTLFLTRLLRGSSSRATGGLQHRNSGHLAKVAALAVQVAVAALAVCPQRCVFFHRGALSVQSKSFVEDCELKSTQIKYLRRKA